MNTSPLDATHALVRGLSPRFAECVTSVPNDGIDLAKAYVQHEAYVNAIKALVDVIHVPESEEHPDCCFVEDTCVVLDAHVVLNRMGHASRRGEVDSVANAVASRMECVRMPEPATLDGGDVLNTSRHRLVGISSRTNHGGVDFLNQQLVKLGMEKVVTVDMADLVAGEPVLHLKCIVSSLDYNTLVVSDEPLGRELVKKYLAPLKYDIVMVPDRLPSNVLAFPAKRTMIVQGGFPNSLAKFQQARPDWRIVQLDMSEFIKADGALTCCSVMISRWDNTHS